MANYGEYASLPRETLLKAFELATLIENEHREIFNSDDHQKYIQQLYAQPVENDPMFQQLLNENDSLKQSLAKSNQQLILNQKISTLAKKIHEKIQSPADGLDLEKEIGTIVKEVFSDFEANGSSRRNTSQARAVSNLSVPVRLSASASRSSFETDVETEGEGESEERGLLVESQGRESIAPEAIGSAAILSAAGATAIAAGKAFWELSKIVGPKILQFFESHRKAKVEVKKERCFNPNEAKLLVTKIGEIALPIALLAIIGGVYWYHSEHKKSPAPETIIAVIAALGIPSLSFLHYKNTQYVKQDAKDVLGSVGDAGVRLGISLYDPATRQSLLNSTEGGSSSLQGIVAKKMDDENKPWYKRALATICCVPCCGKTWASSCWTWIRGESNFPADDSSLESPA